MWRTRARRERALGGACLAWLALAAGPAPLPRDAAAPRAGAPHELSLRGLQARVTVRRDARGIPYIEAASEHDLFLAQGYVTASDRLWQMDLLRRTARGRLAEIFGRDALEQDAQTRTLGFGPLADGLVAHVGARMQKALAAYAEGVNACIASRSRVGLPAEFRILGYEPEPWQSSDSIVIGKLFALDLSNSWPTDIMRASFADLPASQREALFPEVSPLDVVLVGGEKRPDGPKTEAADPEVRPEAVRAARRAREAAASALARVGLYARALAASNNWVVAGARSVTGRPLLANDPHLSASAPSIWYLTHLSAPGLRVAGVTTPGVVGILIGHNDHVAWGVTNLMADVQDLYAESSDSLAGSRAPLVRNERILVRDAGPGTPSVVVERQVTVTRHGPVVLESNGRRYALRWSALEPDASELAAFFDLDSASNWEQFTTALRRFAGPPLNFVYADASGHIGYYAAGRIPVRATGDGTVPYDGSTNTGEWTGYVPFDELPHLFDPPTGVILTANNRIVGREYPHLITRAWDVPYRARRISELLASKPRLSPDDFQSMQADTYSYADAIFARAVVEVAKTQGSAQPERAAMLQALDGWDGRASADSRVLPLAAAMRRQFTQKVLAVALGAGRVKDYEWPNRDTLIDEIVTARPARWLPKEYETYADLLLACWNEARAGLADRAGPDETHWTLGRLRGPLSFPHPLAELPGGELFAVGASSDFAAGGSETVNAGVMVSMRFIADPSDWDRSRQGIALGESGDPTSPHWKDQLPDWLAVKTPAFPFSRDAVARAAVETLVLAPEAPR